MIGLIAQLLQSKKIFLPWLCSFLCNIGLFFVRKRQVSIFQIMLRYGWSLPDDPFTPVDFFVVTRALFFVIYIQWYGFLQFLLAKMILENVVLINFKAVKGGNSDIC